MNVCLPRIPMYMYVCMCTFAIGFLSWNIQPALPTWLWAAYGNTLSSPSESRAAVATGNFVSSVLSCWQLNVHFKEYYTPCTSTVTTHIPRSIHPSPFVHSFQKKTLASGKRAAPSPINPASMHFSHTSQSHEGYS